MKDTELNRSSAGVAGPIAPGSATPIAAATQSNEATLQERRRSPRYELSAKVVITVFAQVRAGADPSAELERVKLVRQGFSVDLSPHGLCMVVEGHPAGITVQQLVGQTAKIRLDLNQPGETELNILGRIAWAKESPANTKIGIQFTEIPLSEAQALLRHCQDDESELEQLSTLWELLVAPPRNS